MKPNNVLELMAQEEIDGALVGGRRSIRNRSRRL